jgi:hypothetical protein
MFLTISVLFRLDNNYTYIYTFFTILNNTSPSQQQYRRIAAIVGSVGVTVYGVLVAEYSFPGKEEEDHVFSHVQASFRGALDQYVYGIMPSSSSTGSNGLEQQRQQQQQRQQSASNTNQPGER